MEYLDGVTLDSLLKIAGRLSHEKAVDLGLQLCQGLLAVHGQHVIHGDLRPANVIVDGNGRLKITALGSVAPEPAMTEAEALSFLAPEQLAGEGVSVKTDVYALGLVLYEMFTGLRAFVSESREELARLQREAPPRRPSELVEGVQPDVERIIMRCLKWNPEERPSSVREVANVLRQRAQ